MVFFLEQSVTISFPEVRKMKIHRKIILDWHIYNHKCNLKENFSEIEHSSVFIVAGESININVEYNVEIKKNKKKRNNKM